MPSSPPLRRRRHLRWSRSSTSLSQVVEKRISSVCNHSRGRHCSLPSLSQSPCHHGVAILPRVEPSSVLLRRGSGSDDGAPPLAAARCCSSQLLSGQRLCRRGFEPRRRFFLGTKGCSYESSHLLQRAIDLVSP